MNEGMPLPAREQGGRDVIARTIGWALFAVTFAFLINN
jgi:hypothetical protein